MRIEIWADVVCPWAYIGKRRVEAAAALLGGEVEGGVEVLWRPYRIDPSAPAVAEPLEEALREPVADGALEACSPGLGHEENRARVAEIARAEGLGPKWGAVWRVDSGPAHRLLALAWEHRGAQVQNAVAEGVMRAHFTEEEDIGDRAVLARIAEQAGFPEGPGLLDAGGGEREVRELLLYGKARGVATSPTLVVGGRSLEGAQPAEAIAGFLRGGTGPAPLPPEVERFRLAEALLERRDPLGALEMLAPMLRSHGGDRGVRLLAARCRFASAQLNGAERELRSLVEEDPGDSYARLLLGRTLYRRNRDAEAAPHLRMAAAMNPDYA
ncbi:DsbA family protein [Nocardiopsis sp. CNT-189]|uniref:DsbA family protein n=1 Tax=Nocardiopsis oceanisediminis TaxID=2816862 RepID=UPI003B2C7D7B